MPSVTNQQSAFKFPASKDWDKWRPEFETQFQIFLNAIILARIGEGGTISPVRIYSPFNKRTFIEFEPDGTIRAFENGVAKTTWS